MHFLRACWPNEHVRESEGLQCSHKLDSPHVNQRCNTANKTVPHARRVGGKQPRTRHVKEAHANESAYQTS